jgi:YgiT-type zinc finger domain-containing protein
MVGCIQEEDSTMKRIRCQAEMKKDTNAFPIDRKGCHLVLDTAPAWVCDLCGEPHFEEREVDAIQDLVRSVEEKAEAPARTSHTPRTICAKHERKACLMPMNEEDTLSLRAKRSNLGRQSEPEYL